MEQAKKAVEESFDREAFLNNMQHASSGGAGGEDGDGAGDEGAGGEDGNRSSGPDTSSGGGSGGGGGGSRRRSTLTIPQHPEPYAFWLARNLPLDSAQRLQLLQTDSVVERLRLEIGWLKAMAGLYCNSCTAPIANQREMFSFGADGAVNAYVNPAGAVHETLTVKAVASKTCSLLFVGSPSTEHSWFPGWAWHIVLCSRCGSHLGWQFSATKAGLQPEVFYGLTRDAVGTRGNPEELQNLTLQGDAPEQTGGVAGGAGGSGIDGAGG
mgnify:CR=1 FL=1